MTDPLDGLFVPAGTVSWRPDPRTLPARPTTRFAPAPTGDLHLGHLVNALYTWGIARATGGRVILRIEDHDRQRSRSEHERLILDDLERLGLIPDEPSLAELRSGAPSPFRQSDDPGPYDAALERLRAAGRLYPCDCSRATYAAYEARAGRAFSGPGCPGRCRERGVEAADDVGLRAALGAGNERWTDLLCGPVGGDPSAGGDLLVRDRLGNRTYALAVVVDDLRHGIDLVIRGRDLLDATPAQLRLGTHLGRERPPAFLHHPLVRRATGDKLSKAAGDVAVRTLLDAGRTPGELLGLAARLAGLLGPGDERTIEPDEVGSLFAA